MNSIKINLIAVCVFFLLNCIQAKNIDNTRDLKEKVPANPRELILYQKPNSLVRNETKKFKLVKYQKEEVCNNPDSHGFKKRENTNNYYKNFDNSYSWNEAKDNCESYGARLPIINNSEDNDYLRSLLDISAWGYGYYWIGLHSESNPMDWKWIDNSPVSYKNWGYGEPYDYISWGFTDLAAGDWYNPSYTDYNGWFVQVKSLSMFSICELSCNADDNIINTSTSITPVESTEDPILDNADDNIINTSTSITPVESTEDPILDNGNTILNSLQQKLDKFDELVTKLEEIVSKI